MLNQTPVLLLIQTSIFVLAVLSRPMFLSSDQKQLFCGHTLEILALLFSFLLLISTIAWGSFVRFWLKKDSHLGSPIFASSKKNVMFFSFLVVFLQSLLGNRKQKQLRQRKKKQCYYHSDAISDFFLSQQIGTLMDWLHLVSSCSGLCFSFGEVGSRPQHLLHGRQGFHQWKTETAPVLFFSSFETGSLCVVMAVLELTMYTRLS